MADRTKTVGVHLELRRIVWHWPQLVERLGRDDPELAGALGRSAQPLEAERHREGGLTLVLGCWWQPDMVLLSGDVARARLERGLGRMLEDQLRAIVVRWPAGMAVAGEAEDGAPTAPDLLAGLPDEAREAAAECESPLQRYFFAGAYRRGLRPQCQLALGRFRLDFAFPREQVAAEVVGWNWHRIRGAGVPGEREEQLGVANWRVRWFSGAEVVADLGRCLDELQAMLVRTQALFTRGLRETRRLGSGQRWTRYERRPRR